MKTSKLNLRDKILCSASGVVLVAASVAGILFLVFKADIVLSFLGDVSDKWKIWMYIIIFIACVIVLFLGLHSISLLRSRREKGVVLQQTEYGEMSISMNAIRSMVKNVVMSQNDIAAEAMDVRHSHNGISIDLRVAVPGGQNIPFVVNNLQKQVKQYISNSSGIEVDTVRVLVETDSSASLQTKHSDLKNSGGNESESDSLQEVFPLQNTANESSEKSEKIIEEVLEQDPAGKE